MGRNKLNMKTQLKYLCIAICALFLVGILGSSRQPEPQQTIRTDGTLAGFGNDDSPLVVDTSTRAAGVATQYMINALKAIVYSGIYTPTPTTRSNHESSPTMSDAQYMRVGNTVTVSGQFVFNPAEAATETEFRFDVPIASDFADPWEACGIAFSADGNDVAEITANASGEVKARWYATDTSERTWSYHYTYQIIE